LAGTNDNRAFKQYQRNSWAHNCYWGVAGR
jgi:hypothetical protein